jgi:hypothetical protein
MGQHLQIAHEAGNADLARKIAAKMREMRAALPPPGPHQPGQVDQEKFTAPPAVGNVPAGFLTGDPAQDRQISENLRNSGASPKDLTKSDVAHAALIGGGLVAGMVPGVIPAMVGGSLQSLGMSHKPGLKDAVFGALGGYVGARGAQVVHDTVKAALPASQRMALKIYSPTSGDTQAAEDAYGSWENAGEQITKEGGATPGTDMRTRRTLWRAHGKRAGQEIDRVLEEADRQGNKVDADSVIGKLKALRDKYFGGATEGTTPALRSGRKAADELISRVEQQFSPGYKPTGTNVDYPAAPQGEMFGAREQRASMVPGPETNFENPPPQLVLDEGGNAITHKPVLGATVRNAQASVPQAQSEMDLAANASNRADARSASALSRAKAAANRAAAQGGKPASDRVMARVEQIRQEAGQAAQTAEDAQTSFENIKNVGPEGTVRDPSLRRGQHEGYYDSSRARPSVQPGVDQGTTRAQAGTGEAPLTTEGQPVPTEQGVATQRDLFEQPTFPEQQPVTPTSTNVKISHQPLSAWEKLKRVLGDEGFMDSGKYYTPEAAEHDPAVKFYREATGAVKNANEEAINDPALRRVFQAAKEDSGAAQQFEPLANRAAQGEMAGASKISGNVTQPKTLAEHVINDVVMSRARPYVASGLRTLGTDPQIREIASSPFLKPSATAMVEALYQSMFGAKQ